MLSSVCSFLLCLPRVLHILMYQINQKSDRPKRNTNHKNYKERMYKYSARLEHKTYIIHKNNKLSKSLYQNGRCITASYNYHYKRFSV